MLLERDRQLEQLDIVLADAAAGHGRIVLVSGEAGSGKTSLLGAFIERSPGARVLRSFCEDLSIPDALGPLYDLAREARSVLTRHQGQSQFSLFSAALSMLSEESRATIVIIEDLHWADDATVDFVRYAGRRIEHTRVLLLLTARTESAVGQRRLRRALADVPAAFVTRIEVPLLSEAAVEALAEQPGVNARAIYLATAGNALFVTELLRAGPTLQLPGSVREAVLARVERLSRAVRDALDLVSVFPRRAEAELLRTLLDRSIGLDAAVDAGMLEWKGDSYSFRHEIARRALEAELPGFRRRDLNARVLAVLRGQKGIPVARLAHHAQEAGDTAAIAELSPAAGAWASSVGAHHQAARHYKAASQASAGEADLLQALAIECHMIGRLDDALAAEHETLVLHRDAGRTTEVGASLRWLSRFSYLAGRRNDAERFGHEAVLVLERLPPSGDLAAAYANLSQLEMLADHEAAALDWCDRARQLAETLDRQDIVCVVLNNMGTAQRWRELDTARRLLRSSLDVALTNNWQEHAARAYTNLGSAEVELRRIDEGIATLTAGIAYCGERDLDTLRLYMKGWLARAHLMRGEWSSAQDAASSVLADELATNLARFQASETIARLRLRRGDPAVAEPLAELESFLVTGREFQRLMPYATLMAERAWLTSKGIDGALALLDEARALSPAPAANADLDLWSAILTGGRLDWPRLAAERAALGMPFEEAVALLHGDEASARKGLARLEQLGATAVLEHARSLLVERGMRGPRRTTLAHGAGLTIREDEVLRLLSDGLSNKSIAQALKISPKTVDHHVSAVIGKMGATSRGHAIALAWQQGLL